MNELVQALHEELAANGSAERREKMRHFFKEDINPHGLDGPLAKKIWKAHLARTKHLPKAELFALCEELWQSGWYEEGIIACEWCNSRHKEFVPEDMALFSRWLDDYVDNWAACDVLCNHGVGSLLPRYPEQVAELKAWARAGGRWKRRAAAVSLILPARQGLFLPDIFEIAEILLEDTDDLVQKGYGWMLKAASEAQPREVYDFLLARKALMPRTAFRYALEKMPADWRKEAMKK